MTMSCAVDATMVWAGADVVRAVDQPAVRETPDLDAWVAGLGPEERVDLQGRTETQLVRGEPVVELQRTDGWSQIVVPGQASSKSPDGYPGWVPAAHLGSLSDAQVVPPAQEATTIDALVAAAQLVGTPYIWGGCGGSGIDCSGLVLAAHRSLGHLVPRDARDQMAAATPVALDERRRGDLLFFARPGKPAHHVAFDAGEGRILHASMGGGGGCVECAPMPEQYAGTLVAAGRFLPV
jgi:gamma-D-glutamyl-L-lysine dipeptidyl-peptidase